MNRIEWIVLGLLGFYLLVGATWIMADPEVKYCKNWQTGEIFVVEVNMPCPFPTVEL